MSRRDTQIRNRVRQLAGELEPLSLDPEQPEPEPLRLVNVIVSAKSSLDPLSENTIDIEAESVNNKP
jgi:hypothetical protein